MKLFRTALFGSAAAIAGSMGAQAADLPVRKAAPVDYVRVCDFTGAGFFYIPGTDSCIQLSGYVRIQGAFINNQRQFYPAPVLGNATSSVNLVNLGTGRAVIPGGSVIPGRLQDQHGFYARGRLNADVRTQTAYGELRAYLRLQGNRFNGVYSTGGVGTTGSATGVGLNGLTTSVVTLDRGFIQFAGITAGRVQSFFDFYADNYNYEGIANSDQSTNVFAYTYNVGGGLSATLSIESHEVRSDPIGNISGYDGFGPNLNVTNSAIYGGSQIPDIVGVIRYDQAWGSAQLSGAYHQINTISGPFAGTGGQGFQQSNADGFAVQGGVRLKLPMLAAGDDLWIQGAYQNGAYLYQDSALYQNAGFYSRYLGGFEHIDHDAIALGRPGTAGAYSLSLSEGFSVLAAINHFFTPNFHDVLFGSYEESSYGRAGLVDWTLGGVGRASQYRIGNQFLFDPVKNFEIGLEFDYAHIDQTLAHDPGRVASRLPVGVSRNPDGFEAILRLERDF